MIGKFVEWQKKKYSKTQRLLFDVLAVPFFFFILIPGSAYFISQKVSLQFPLPQILPSPVNSYVGLLVFALGLWLFLWTISIFYKVGGGTPSPIIPTQKLVTEGPYGYCRNPMYLGVIFWICGFGIILNSFWFILAGLIIPFFYLIYVKLIEEKELELRFGKEYPEYKKRVPFLIPAIFKKR